MSNKGVKKIALAPDNTFYPKMGGGKILVIPGGGKSKFTVTEWLPYTTDADKNKILWRLYDNKKIDVIVQYQGAGSILNNFSISKKLSGAQAYYLGASLTGKPDTKDESGLLVRGYCPQKIVSSSWSMQPGGADIRKKEKISYGEDVNLSLVTEGLNGYTLTVVVYCRKWGTDKKIFTYTNIECTNGEVNFMIRNTFTWFSKIGADKIEHELYVKVCIDGTTDYIKDDHQDDSHARYP